jgi:hypothetical protein
MWFTRYLELKLNGGSLTDVCRKHGKRDGYEKILRNWSGPNRWIERIEAYRDFLYKEQQKQRLKDIEEMDERQAKYGVLLQQQAALYFHEKQLTKEGIHLTAEQAMRFIEVGSRVERTARGAPAEIKVEVEIPDEDTPEKRAAKLTRLEQELKELDIINAQ